MNRLSHPFSSHPGARYPMPRRRSSRDIALCIIACLLTWLMFKPQVDGITDAISKVMR